MKKGLLIILSGPSGVGKGTIRKEIMSKYPNLDLHYSISMTTREPRSGEVDGQDYFFVSFEDFKNNINNDKFLEYSMFVGNYYGTPKAYVEKMRNEGHNVVLEIETVGAKQIMNAYKYDDRCISIFLTPPDMKELEARIRKRSTESEKTIEKRVLKATQELRETFRYKYVVCNEDVDDAVEKIADIIKENIAK